VAGRRRIAPEGRRSAQRRDRPPPGPPRETPGRPRDGPGYGEMGPATARWAGRDETAGRADGLVPANRGPMAEPLDPAPPGFENECRAGERAQGQEDAERLRLEQDCHREPVFLFPRVRAPIARGRRCRGESRQVRVHISTSVRPSSRFRQPGGLRSHPGDPWLCDPALRRVCPGRDCDGKRHRFQAGHGSPTRRWTQ
jgi:hypothetical protein